MHRGDHVGDSKRLEFGLGRSVSIEQAARLLGVSRRTIYNRIRDGKLQTIRTLGGSQRVLLSSLKETDRAIWAKSEVGAGVPRSIKVGAGAPRSLTAGAGAPEPTKDEPAFIAGAG